VSAPNSKEPRPTWGALWGILAVLLVLGTVALATVVYGLIGLVAGNLVASVPLVVGAIGSVVVFLLMAGILYRVDRVRGVAHRRVELFE
jgi:hypothetical protein